MKKLKKGLKVLPKKILSLFLAIATLFTNVIPLTTVFAITGEERANLVEIKLRRANDIHIDDNTATIDYNGGNITVTGTNLDYEIDHNYDYGNDHGTVIYLYTNSTSLNFIMHPDENHESGYWLDGRPERLDGNEYPVNNLQIGQGYEYEFFFNYNEPYEPHPTGASYMVDFEENAHLYFKGSDENKIAYVEIKLYGNASDDACNQMTNEISNIINEIFGIDKSNIYVSYFPTDKWGWNGNNF